jgi:hypothetical protein
MARARRHLARRCTSSNPGGGPSCRWLSCSRQPRLQRTTPPPRRLRPRTRSDMPVMQQLSPVGTVRHGQDRLRQRGLASARRRSLESRPSTSAAAPARPTQHPTRWASSSSGRFKRWLGWRSQSGRSRSRRPAQPTRLYRHSRGRLPSPKRRPTPAITTAGTARTVTGRLRAPTIAQPHRLACPSALTLARHSRSRPARRRRRARAPSGLRTTLLTLLRRPSRSSRPSSPRTRTTQRRSPNSSRRAASPLPTLRHRRLLRPRHRCLTRQPRPHSAGRSIRTSLKALVSAASAAVHATCSRTSARRARPRSRRRLLARSRVANRSSSLSLSSTRSLSWRPTLQSGGPSR